MFLFYFAFIAIIVSVIVIWAVRRVVKSPLTQLSQSLGIPEGNPLVVERHGRSFTAKYTPSSKNSPAMVRITAPVDEAARLNVFGEGRGYVDTRPYLVLRRETGTDRFGKRHELNREIVVGDAAFDSAVYLETDSSETNVKRTLADKRLREAVCDLLDTGARRVVLGPKGLYTERAIRSGQAPGDGIDRDMALLAECAAALPFFKAGSADKPRWLFESMLIIFAIVAVITLIVLSVPAPLDVNAKFVGFGGGLALWTLVMVGAIKLLRGRSDSLGRIGALLITTLIILPWGSYEVLCWANKTFDTSPGVSHATKVVRTWTSNSKSNTYYHVDVAPWRPEAQIVTLNVSAAFAQQARPGRGITVTTRAGRLGWEWVDMFRLTP